MYFDKYFIKELTSCEKLDIIKAKSPTKLDHLYLNSTTLVSDHDLIRDILELIILLHNSPN